MSLAKKPKRRRGKGRLEKGPHGRRANKRGEMQRYASQLLQLNEEGESFMQKLHRLIEEAGEAAHCHTRRMLLIHSHHSAISPVWQCRSSTTQLVETASVALSEHACCQSRQYNAH